MPNAEEYQREKIQKLKRKQLSAREIAEKVGVPISFVYKVTTGKRFKTSLHKYRVELGIEKLNNAAVAGKLASNALAMLAADPARLAELTPRDIKDLGVFSNSQFEAGRAIIAKEIHDAEESINPEMQHARELVEARRKMKQVNDGPHEEAQTEAHDVSTVAPLPHADDEPADEEDESESDPTVPSYDPTSPA